MKAEKNQAAEGKKSSAASEQTPTVVLEDSGIGDVKIHENVISALARSATLGIEGVSRLAGSLLVDNIAEIVGSRRMQERAITVSMDENSLSLEIKINIIDGYRVPEVAAAVQKAVISKIETATGMNVTRVNVLVQEIEAPQEQDDDDAADAGDVIGTMPIEPTR